LLPQILPLRFRRGFRLFAAGRPRRRTAVGRATPLIACPDCGAFFLAPHPAPGQRARCPRCRAVLWAGHPRGAGLALPLALAALPLLPLAFLEPLLQISLLGQRVSASLITGPLLLDENGWQALAALVVLTACLLPVARLLGLIAVLAALRRPRPRPHPLWRAILRGSERLRPFAMVEVYLLGLFVAYSKLIDLARVHVELAAYALAALMLVMAVIDQLVDPRALWKALAGAHPPPPGAPKLLPATQLIGCTSCGLVSQAREGNLCPRCFSRLARRKKRSLARTLALVIAAFVLYIPANLLPVMTVDYYGQGTPNTILSGVAELASAGMWPLAALVFFASITVPVLKLAGLVLLMVSARRGWAGRLHDRTRLYRLIDAIGRWSMIDVFMISILVGLVRLGLLASVHPEAGAVAFAAVVVLTLFAAESFDPRLMWDTARRSPRPLPPGGGEAAP